MLLTTDEIVAMMAEVSKTYEACKTLTERLRAMCPHEEYVEGLTMIGCIQKVMLCRACGEVKPYERGEDSHGMDHSIQFGG
jgi:hypothetical protein